MDLANRLIPKTTSIPFPTNQATDGATEYTRSNMFLMAMEVYSAFNVTISWVSSSILRPNV